MRKLITQSRKVAKFKLLFFLWDAVCFRGWYWNYYNKKVWYVNTKTGEVHVLGIKCRALKIHNPKNFLKLSEWELWEYKKSHPRINGCFHCNKSSDTDRVHAKPESRKGLGSCEISHAKPESRKEDGVNWISPVYITQQMLLWG